MTVSAVLDLQVTKERNKQNLENNIIARGIIIYQKC